MMQSLVAESGKLVRRFVLAEVGQFFCILEVL